MKRRQLTKQPSCDLRLVHRDGGHGLYKINLNPDDTREFIYVCGECVVELARREWNRQCAVIALGSK